MKLLFNEESYIESTGKSILQIPWCTKDKARLNKSRHDCDCLVVGFTTIYAISAYHHLVCEFESRSARGVQHYVIKFIPQFSVCNIYGITSYYFCAKTSFQTENGWFRGDKLIYYFFKNCCSRGDNSNQQLLMKFHFLFTLFLNFYF